MNRILKELKLFNNDPPPGICLWAVDDSLKKLRASIEGPSGTPYEKGSFGIEIVLPNRYPLEPPKCCFITRIYHPNIDSSGRICLDLLKMKPRGSWTPAINIPTLLKSLQLLISSPNTEDALVAEIAKEYRENRTEFNINALAHTNKYATKIFDNEESQPTMNTSKKRIHLSESPIKKQKRINSNDNIETDYLVENQNRIPNNIHNNPLLKSVVLSDSDDD